VASRRREGGAGNLRSRAVSSRRSGAAMKASNEATVGSLDEGQTSRHADRDQGENGGFTDRTRGAGGRGRTG
jgi:hypothetical protein